MVTADQIIALVDAIVAADAPEAVVLFGSYAYGTPTYDSDVDLLVVREYEGQSPDRAAAISMQLPPLGFPMDLIVRSRSEIARRVAMRDWFLKEITENGVTLYASDDAGVGRQGRERLRGRLPLDSGVQDHPAVGTRLLSRPTIG
jgi:predicted nucleotidyltransferase